MVSGTLAITDLLNNNIANVLTFAATQPVMREWMEG
jgi:hypothetical protein